MARNGGLKKMTYEKEIYILLSGIRGALITIATTLILMVVLFVGWASYQAMGQANAADTRGNISSVNIKQVDGKDIGIYGTPLPVRIIKD